MQFLQALSGYMGIDLSGRQIAVAQQELNDTQVSAMIKQMGGKGMTQGMRRYR